MECTNKCLFTPLDNIWLAVQRFLLHSPKSKIHSAGQIPCQIN